MSTGRRVSMVAEQIRDIMAMHLQEVSDPRFSLVTVTSVQVTHDLGYAKVYWSVMGDQARIPEVEAAFDSASGMFRQVIARKLGVRYVPEIKFFYDDTLDEMEKIDKLLKKASS